MLHLSRARTPTVIINLIPSCRSEYPSLSFRSNIGRYKRGYMPYDGSYLEQNNCAYAPYRDLASVEIENSTSEI
jgi:hypothetical protein